MRRFVGILLSGLVVSLPVHSDPLWQSAVNLFGQNRDVYAARMLTTSAEYDGRGQQRTIREVEMTMEVADDGSLTRSLVWVRQDGKPVDVSGDSTEIDPLFSSDAQATGHEGRAASMQVLENSPFDPEMQSRLHYRRVGPVAGDNVDREIEFRYRLTAGSTTIEGQAWLCESTGAPRRLLATVSPMPRFVREMTVEQYFETSSAGWYTTEVNVRAEGGFLFIRRTVTVNLRFFDHRTSPVPLQEKDPT
jgi:hypothetical protein